MLKNFNVKNISVTSFHGPKKKLQGNDGRKFKRVNPWTKLDILGSAEILFLEEKIFSLVRNNVKVSVQIFT